MMNSAAVILCAGKGTRMNDDSLNKVCFPCAGVPVIRRIVSEMKAGGVGRFAIVVGHNPKDVMDALDGIDGVIYAYQKEQKGTGHAALCGLKALSSMGYTGSVIVSMGDKIVHRDVISSLLAKSWAEGVQAVWGVQPAEVNPAGGRVLIRDGKPMGVVELADAALMSLADTDKDKWREKLAGIGLNPKKAEKVIAKASILADEGKHTSTVSLNGHAFSADEIISSEYANAGLYCFELDAAMEAIGRCSSDNAQGEIYLTDTLALFAESDGAVTEEIKSGEQMLTYSTKPELAVMSRHFMRRASDICAEYNDARYAELGERFIRAFGDTPAILTRAPGRINLMGRHIDHRGGNINVMAINYDTLMLVSPRDDGIVRAVNTDGKYADGEFSISEELSLAPHDSWLGYLDSEDVKERLSASRGSWINYIKSAVLRLQLEADYPLCGMNIAVCGNIPPAAGLSSSSSVVVASAEAVNALNCMNLSVSRFIELCGEGEWFVGSRGGAGDHAAMKTGSAGYITRMGFKPFTLGGQTRFSDDYAVIVVNSMIQAKKSEGSRSRFNEKVACYELALMLLRKKYPGCGLAQFRDLAEITPRKKIYEMLLSLPERATREELRALLGDDERLAALFATHSAPEYYDLRGVALYGVSECARAKRFMDILSSGDYEKLGEMIKISHRGDRVSGSDGSAGSAGSAITDGYLESLIARDADPEEEYGAYGCSTAEIDALCDKLDGTEGVLGSSIVGAGLGGSIIALVRRDRADEIIDMLNREYYDTHGYTHAAFVCVPSAGAEARY